MFIFGGMVWELKNHIENLKKSDDINNIFQHNFPQVTAVLTSGFILFDWSHGSLL